MTTTIITFIIINLLAINVAFILDYFFKDPSFRLHPIILVGNLAKTLEKKLYKDNKARGLLVWSLVCLISIGLSIVILYLSYKIHMILFIFIYILLSWLMQAAGSLKQAALQVYIPLKQNNLTKAREKLGWIVARETKQLEKEKVINACIETVSENTSDGECAVLFYQAIGGLPLALLYKCINTMDSMFGYKNEKYNNFGYFSAKIDDIANLLPARLSSILMLLSTKILKYNFKNALKIYKRDRYNHTSPNAGFLESVTAGALEIQLGGPNIYFNKIVNKPFIGDKIKEVDYQDINKTIQLMYTTSLLLIVMINIIYLIVLNFIG
ncbi:adenosylcobinamide-phosphate synthase CbiB [Mycoplasma sp. P36-A1]|uniref:adenosylcobinamide-phosphate synthase CbiB n=1 Tax=Mycoplasma sp. P36-A1 TaxID=3252900 RepID=UPI003C2EC513